MLNPNYVAVLADNFPGVKKKKIHQSWYNLFQIKNTNKTNKQIKERAVR